VETSLLLGKTVLTIWLFRSEGVHPAWVDDLTLPIVGFDAFLEFADGDLIKISPCEVDMGPDGYPSLGLDLQPWTSEALHFLSPSGHAIEAVPLEEAALFTPFSIVGVEESDPLGQDTVSQYSLATSNGRRIAFRHIFPPMTLGMCIDVMGGTPNNSFNPKPLRGST
jgi:hypothetical protein